MLHQLLQVARFNVARVHFQLSQLAIKGQVPLSHLRPCPARRLIQWQISSDQPEKMAS